MKIAVEQDKPTFQPVRVEIVVETQEELIALRCFLARDIIIPEALRAEGEMTALAGYNLLYPALYDQLREVEG